VNFCVLVFGVDHAREIEQFCPLVDLGPEPVLHLLLGLLKPRLVLERVQVGQHAHDSRKPVNLQTNKTGYLDNKYLAY